MAGFNNQALHKLIGLFLGMIDSVHFSKNIIVSNQPSPAELKAGREFEAVLLTNFVEQMLPENMGVTEASQAGADVWRSFMATAVADQLASQNTLGIAGLISNQLMHVRTGNTYGA